MGEWDPRRLTTAAPASRAFVAAALLAFVVITSFVAAHHEMWRDEADAWLFARDGDFAHLVDWTRHAGTPALWYLLLAPLAKGGAPYPSQQMLHLAVIAAAAAVFLAKAPLTRLTKLLVLFSYYFAYEYAVVVRSYALSLLLIALAAAMHQRRAERPIPYALVLALLFNANAQGFVVAAALAVLFAVRVRKPLPIAIVIAGALAAWWQVRAPADPMRAGLRHAFDPAAVPWTLAAAFLPTMPLLAGAILGTLVLVALIYALRRSPEALALLAIALGGLFILYSFVWVGGFRHAGLVLVVVLAAVWIARDVELPAAALLLNGVLLISVAVAARAAISDVQAPFSGSREMASWMRANRLDRRPVAAHNLTQCEAVLAYLPPRTFWYAGLARDGSYMTWDSAFERALNVPYPVAEQRARVHFGRGDWLLLFNVEIPDPRSHGFRLLHVSPEPFEKTDERFWLYAPLP
jgi:hypothetical protein